MAGANKKKQESLFANYEHIIGCKGGYVGNLMLCHKLTLL